MSDKSMSMNGNRQPWNGTAYTYFRANALQPDIRCIKPYIITIFQFLLGTDSINHNQLHV